MYPFLKTVYYICTRLREDGYIRSRPSSKMDTLYAEAVSWVRLYTLDTQTMRPVSLWIFRTSIVDYSSRPLLLLTKHLYSSRRLHSSVRPPGPLSVLRVLFHSSTLLLPRMFFPPFSTRFWTIAVYSVQFSFPVVRYRSIVSLVWVLEASCDDQVQTLLLLLPRPLLFLFTLIVRYDFCYRR